MFRSTKPIPSWILGFEGISIFYDGPNSAKVVTPELVSFVKTCRLLCQRARNTQNDAAVPLEYGVDFDDTSFGELFEANSREQIEKFLGAFYRDYLIEIYFPTTEEICEVFIHFFKIYCWC